jgi:hypothetical protein
VSLLILALKLVCYPHPFLAVDTFQYLDSAVHLKTNVYRPIGYSIFLASAHFLRSSPVLVVVLQHLLHAAAVLFLVSTLADRRSCPGRGSLILGLVLLLDPLPCFYSHWLLSDSLFNSILMTFAAAVVRHDRHPGWRWLAAAIVAAGTCAALRHVGILCFPYLIVHLVLRGGRRFLPALGACILGAGLILGGMAWKMKKDHGVFALGTFDGWALRGNVAQLIDCSPEYLEGMPQGHLRGLYSFFCDFPSETYGHKDTDWYRWNEESPAKQAVSYYTTKGYGYDESWIRVNAQLRMVGLDILRHRPGRFLTTFVLPNLGHAFVPRIDPGALSYPRKEETNVIVRYYYGQDTRTWTARYEPFARIAPGPRLWLPLLWLGAIASWLRLMRAPSSEAEETRRAVVHIVGLSLVYVVVVAATHPFHLRYLTPVTSLLAAASGAGFLAGRSGSPGVRGECPSGTQGRSATPPA